MKKPKIPKSLQPAHPSTKPVFGSAKGQIVFKKGWDAPMTQRELDEFIGD